MNHPAVKLPPPNSLAAALVALLMFDPLACCADPAVVNISADIAYKTGDALSPYETERCRLDFYAPVGAKNLPCLVWFHGGGLTGGTKSTPLNRALCEALASEGILVAAVNYRLSPQVKFPAYLQDAAAAVSWVRQHAAEHGGDPAHVFVGGHSAGGYLTAMLGTDAGYLRAAGVNRAELAGFIPISGQMMTHFTVREERGLPRDAMIADGAAPINHVGADTPPWLILYADQDYGLHASENRFFVDAMRHAGHRDLTAREIPHRTHNTIADWIAHPDDPARVLIVDFVRRLGGQEKAKDASADGAAINR